MQPWSQPLLWKGVARDPYFGNVVLLMGYEGVNGATSGPGMTDESPSAHGTATIAGANASISNTQFKFGSTSLHLGGTSSITFPDSADWHLGTGRFTIEFWAYPTTLVSTAYFIAQSGVTPNFGWVSYGSTATLVWSVSTTGVNTFGDLSNTTITANTWQHIAIDYDGTKYREYINGVMIASSTTARNIFNPGTVLSIGSNAVNNNFWFQGYLDEARITKGVARYASDAGFTVPTAAFPRS
jgi:hypothetical protein